MRIWTAKAAMDHVVLVHMLAREEADRRVLALTRKSSQFETTVAPFTPN